MVGKAPVRAKPKYVIFTLVVSAPAYADKKLVTARLLSPLADLGLVEVLRDGSFDVPNSVHGSFATISTKIVDSSGKCNKETAHSDGFLNYGWMADNILKHGDIGSKYE